MKKCKQKLHRRRINILSVNNQLIKIPKYIFQLTTFIGADCTINLVMKVLSIILPMIVSILKHGTFFYNNRKVSYFFYRTAYRKIKQNAFL